MGHLVFDIEGNKPVACKGDFALDTRKVFCLVTEDLHTGEVRRFDNGCQFADEELLVGMELLRNAECLYGHNIVRYDNEVLRLLHKLEFKCDIYDTYVASEVMWPGPKWLRLADARAHKKDIHIPRKLHGRHSLEAWGHRLGIHKIGWEGGFEHDSYCQGMLDYNAQDVSVNVALVRYLQGRGFPDSVVIEESAVTKILRRQELKGVAFDEKGAVDLMLHLTKERDTLCDQLQEAYPPIFRPYGGVVKSKVNAKATKKNPCRNISKGAEYEKMKLVPFNPGSNDQIAARLMKVHGWVPSPTEYTAQGKPQVTEEVLEDLDYPMIPALIKYGNCTKILGYLSEGKNAWLKLVKDGRIHGRVNATGTVTNRMAHKNPNTGNVPRAGGYLGRECRALFRAGRGKVLVGADASGLQLRLLAHYVAPFDGGACATAFTEDDPHTYMMQGTGILWRDNQKTFTYAKLFSAWYKKLGMIKINAFREAAKRGEWNGTIPDNSEAVSVGKAADAGLSALLKMEGLDKGLDKAWKRRFVISLDGRHVPLISRRQVLNTLLMSGEAVVMKRALLIADNDLWAAGLLGWEFVLNVHDEWQVECDKGNAEEIGMILTHAITKAGEQFNLRCRLDGEWKVGDTWADTH